MSSRLMTGRIGHLLIEKRMSLMKMNQMSLLIQ